MPAEVAGVPVVGICHRRKMVIVRTDTTIKCLELLAGCFAICCWGKDKAQCCVFLKMDNVSAVRYINHLGGTKSRALADLAKNFCGFCLENQISVTAE